MNEYAISPAAENGFGKISSTTKLNYGDAGNVGEAVKEVVKAIRNTYSTWNVRFLIPTQAALGALLYWLVSRL